MTTRKTTEIVMFMLNCSLAASPVAIECQQLALAVCSPNNTTRNAGEHTAKELVHAFGRHGARQQHGGAAPAERDVECARTAPRRAKHSGKEHCVHRPDADAREAEVRRGEQAARVVDAAKHRPHFACHRFVGCQQRITTNFLLEINYFFCMKVGRLGGRGE